MKNSDLLPVVETFHSVQGEGFWSGTNAWFIRLAGCDVGCSWCDQKETWSAKPYPKVSVDLLVSEARAAKPAIVVITGGEPLLYDLTELTGKLQQASLRTHLETSGTRLFSGSWDWVTFSPKQFKEPHLSIYPHVRELKIVVKDETDLQWAELEAARLPYCHKFLQPEFETKDSYQLILDYVQTHPEWRISLQTHKLLGVR